MLYADGSLAPLLIFAAFAVISSLRRKAQRGNPPRPAPGNTPAAEPRDGFMTELRRAMEELKQVQQQQSSGTPALPQTSQEKIAAEWLAKQKARKALKPMGRVRSSRAVVPLEDDDADKSSETGASLEGEDYDDEANKVVEARRQAAEQRVVRLDESSETLSTLQQARRASRQVQAIGGTAEHAAWHGEIGAQAKTGDVVKTVRKLGRFADGTARSAIILGEILRPPVGQRDA